MSNTRKNIVEPTELFSPLFGSPDKVSFQIGDGNKVYAVTTHFSSEGGQSVLQQFKDLILAEDLLANRTFDNDGEVL